MNTPQDDSPTLKVRLRPNGHVATKACGRPVAGGEGGYTSFRVLDRPELIPFVDAATSHASELWPWTTGLQ